MTGLGTLGNFTSVAKAVSGDGSVIVGSAGDTPFIWDQENGSRYLQQYLTDELGLDLTGWTLREALAISDDGTTIVGYGENSFAFTEARIAVIPEPSTGLLVGAGLIALAASKRRRGSVRAGRESAPSAGL